MELIVTTMHTRSAHIFAFLFITTAFVAVRTRDIPPFLKICHRSDPNLNECIKRSIDLLRPYLKTGISALQIPSCEPLRVPRIEISQSAGPISIRSTYTDIEVQGGTSFILKSIKTDIDNDRVRLKLYLPRLEMNARYNMEGKILMLPISGNGLARGNFTDIDVIAIVQGERYQSKKTGETHYRVIDFYADIDVGHANIHLDNLFNGDSTLSNAMNLFLNNNWKIVAAEVKPALENAVSEIFKTFSNKIYSKFPFDTLLPP
ncbi:PREDICTED: protein takeout-like [Wasmannia auropunctata]|uniref:protein takeout-like n=1 Tax=Wasmannia auropunctata TaxID=64793 RepID=UPI0005EFB5F6|nr:PREDICTED: protein takeout-like [Wasmannia auropunctata]